MTTTHDRPMFDLGIEPGGVGVNPIGHYPNGKQYGGNVYVEMGCGCVGDALMTITKDSDESWGWSGVDFIAFGWCGCGIHSYDENGQLEDRDELMGADIHGIQAILERRARAKDAA